MTLYINQERNRELEKKIGALQSTTILATPQILKWKPTCYNGSNPFLTPSECEQVNF